MRLSTADGGKGVRQSRMRAYPCLPLLPQFSFTFSSRGCVVALRDDPGSGSSSKPAADDATPAPLGVLTVRVVGAELEPR